MPGGREAIFVTFSVLRSISAAMNSSEQFPMLRSIGRALPQNYYPQEMISAALWNEWGGNDESRARFDRLHRSVGVRGRHLALPMEDYRALDSFSKMNDKWIERATDLGQQAIESALCQAGLEPADIDHIFFTTVTGIASPSIDAKLINRMSMRPDIKRTPIFGLGCVGGAAGLARAADYLRVSDPYRDPGVGRVVFADGATSRQIDCQRYRIGTIRRRRGRGAAGGWRSIRQ